MTTKKGLIEFINNNKFDCDNAYPKEDCTYKRKYEQLLEEIEEYKIKANYFDEVLDVSSWNAMDVGDAVHSIVREYEEDKTND